MKLITPLFLIALVITLASCGTVPQSREHYIELLKKESDGGLWKSLVLIYEKTIPQPIDNVVANIDDKIKTCIYRDSPAYEHILFQKKCLLGEYVRKSFFV